MADKVKKILKKVQEESVSEELEYASEKYACRFSSSKYGHDKVKNTFIAGAKWQEEQFEKNRLKHCDSLTKEQAELEQGFVDQHLDKYQRMPTFLDAIEYGMKLQKEQIMVKAVPEKAVIEEWKRFVESDEFQHNPECGSLLMAQHFAEWGRVNPKQNEE